MCSHSDVSSGRNRKTQNLKTRMDMKHEQKGECRTLGQRSLFLNERLGNVRVSLGLIGLRVWLKYTCVVFVSGGRVGEQKLRRVVDKPAHPPLARQRCKRIIKCANVKHETGSVCKNKHLIKLVSQKTGCKKETSLALRLRGKEQATMVEM